MDSQQGWSQLEILFKNQSVLITCVKCAQACVRGGSEAILYTAAGRITRSIMAGKCVLTAGRVKAKYMKSTQRACLTVMNPV